MTTTLDKFTERARRALNVAEAEAKSFNHNYLGTEHLLLGVVQEPEGIGAQVLNRLGVETFRVREVIERVVGRGAAPPLGKLELVPRAKRSIELAFDESRRRNHNYVGTEHLLLGLLREETGIAAQVLTELGVTLAGAREEVERLVNENKVTGTLPEQIRARIRRAVIRGGEAGPAATKSNVVTCRIDDRDLDALDALVEAGIRSTRSDAAAWLIHAGIEAHRELFEKVYATVADIRGLRAEAQGIAERLAVPAPAPAPPPKETP